MWALLAVFALVYTASAQLPTSCGVPAIQPTLDGSKVVSDTQAVAHSWPWQVQMRYLGSHFCGASIIANGWLLTASHCVYRRPTGAFSFRAGRRTRTGTNEPNEQISAATDIITHESYSPITANNDVSLVRLQTPFVFNDYVSPACLTDTEPTPGTDVWVTGWGQVQGTCCDGQLKQAKLAVVERSTCQSSWLAEENRIVTNGMLCAGTDSGYPSACHGDSGGPLVVLAGSQSESERKFVQVGVVSWGKSGCVDSTLPNIYANVAQYKPWILSKMKQVEKEEKQEALVMRKLHMHRRMGAAFRAAAKSLEFN